MLYYMGSFNLVPQLLFYQNVPFATGVKGLSHISTVVEPDLLFCFGIHY